MCKALQDKPVPNLHIVLHRMAVHWFASTHSKKTRPTLQLTGMHRVIRNNFEIQFALNTKLNELERCCKKDPQKYADLLEGFSENVRLKPVLFQNQ